ncbi:MAG: hypothetical protein KF763_15675 [Cyclobacteriaceae bacterium]|nr:hypothetical protein [Cyclobacteriaceae bacterium]
MKTKEYLKELSLVFLGVLIALLIDNYREDRRDEQTIRSYLAIIAEDLNFDIINLADQLKTDSAQAKKLKLLRDILTTNADLPKLNYDLSSWSRTDIVPYRKLSEWDSLDYYILQLYNNTEYKTRKIGFSTVVNSNLSHRIPLDLLKEITVYYTTDSDFLDFRQKIDDTCHWNAIPYLNQHQGNFKNLILKPGFNSTLLRNEATGRYSTTLVEMYTKIEMIKKAKILLEAISAY